MNLTPEKIQSNFELFYKLSQKDLDRSESYGFFLESLGERLALCPMNCRTEQGWAYHGGLIEYALSVLNHLKKENDAHNLGLLTNEMITVSLFHSIGKVGDLEHELLLPETSTWHQEKLGQFFKFNDKIRKMTVEHRSLWLLNHLGIKITQNEWLAILLSAGALSDESKFYHSSQPKLSVALNNSIRLTAVLKDNK
ncbi:hypothetical protein OAA09_01335 [bacterium]|nr:hypothetical protein [bacterium]